MAALFKMLLGEKTLQKGVQFGPIFNFDHFLRQVTRPATYASVPTAPVKGHHSGHEMNKLPVTLKFPLAVSSIQLGHIET